MKARPFRDRHLARPSLSVGLAPLLNLIDRPTTALALLAIASGPDWLRLAPQKLPSSWQVPAPSTHQVLCIDLRERA